MQPSMRLGKEHWQPRHLGWRKTTTFLYKITAYQIKSPDIKINIEHLHKRVKHSQLLRLTDTHSVSMDTEIMADASFPPYR